MSPLLFIISLEPFIRHILLNSSIRGFKLTDREFKVAAYADDLLFFLTEPHISIPSLMKEFSLYGYISNLKINFSKSEAMNITLPADKLNRAQSNSPFKWENSAIKYLGTWLTPKLSSVFERNFPPILKTIEKDLQNWHTSYFSWFGRAAICKMTVLPKILYLLRTLPIKIPHSFFKKLHALQMKFIWAHKPPRIKASLLTRPKNLGGLGIPDFKSYYHATHLARIIDWHCHSKSKDWVTIENDVSSIPLQFLPWVSKLKYPHTVKTHPLIGASLDIFHSLAKQPKFSSPLSPLTPLKDNPDFPPGMGNHLLTTTDTKMPILAWQCSTNNKNIQTIKDLPRGVVWMASRADVFH